MTELEQAIAAVKSDVAANGPHLGIHNLSTILNAIATGQLVPAQVWQPIETMPDCVDVLVWARGWEIPSIGFASDGVGPYDPISGGEFDPWPTHWMPLPPPPAEGV